MACMMLPRNAQTCVGALLFFCWWGSQRAARRPRPARTVAVERMSAEPAGRRALAAVAAAVGRQSPWVDRAAAAAREIRCGVPVVSRAPAHATSAAVPALLVRRTMVERARPDLRALLVPEAPARAPAPPARAVLPVRQAQ